MFPRDDDDFEMDMDFNGAMGGDMRDMHMRQDNRINAQRMKQMLNAAISSKLPHVQQPQVQQWIQENLQFFTLKPNDTIQMQPSQLLDFICQQIDHSFRKIIVPRQFEVSSDFGSEFQAELHAYTQDSEQKIASLQKRVNELEAELKKGK
ncbi:Hypothetical_protein [Hexamita inflata]|uniref:Hypothetical_protein n=1 Tax=Hexamita inflata TaxID=28002 RepID=A0AA86UC71_9EUKA|nr:Hypothetical protein HINF_LOCUS37514 [Hexamita inflata]